MNASARACHLARLSWLLLLLLLPAVFNPLGALGVEPVKAALLRSIAVVMAASWTISRMLRLTEMTPIGEAPILRAGLLVLGATTFSTLLSTDPVTSFFGTYERSIGWLTIAAGMVVLLSGIDLLTDSHFRQRAASAAAWGALLPCAYAVVQSTGHDPVQWTGVRGLGSSLGSPTFLAGYLVAVLPFALSGVVLAGRDVAVGRRRLSDARYAANLVLCLLIFGVIVRVAIRAGVLGMVAEASVFGFLLLLRSRVIFARTIPMAIGIGVFVGFVGLGLLVGGLSGLPGVRRFIDAGDLSTHAGKSVGERILLWTSAATLPLDTPVHALVGFGPEMQVTAFEHSAAIVRYSPAEQFDRAHNLVVDTWVTGGLLGTLALAVLIVVALCAAWRAYVVSTDPTHVVLASAVLAAWVGHLVEQSFAFPTVVTGTLFWVLAAMSSDCSPTEPVRVRRSAHGSSLWTGVAAAAGLLLIPCMAAPAIADAAHGAALDADGRADYVAAAALATTAAYWAPWAGEPAQLAGAELLALSQSGGNRPEDELLDLAEVQFRSAARQTDWDPFAHLQLARFYLEWAQRQQSRGRDSHGLLDEAENACARGLEVGPYRAEVWQTCAEVSTRLEQTQQAAERLERAAQLR